MCKVYCFLIVAFVLANGCTSRSSSSKQEAADSIAVEELVAVATARELLPLASEEIVLEDDAFGSIIELKGEQKILDCEPFKLSEPEMWFKDGYFLMQNLVHEGMMYMLFRMPDFEHVTSFGQRGNGPDEFLFPHIVPTSRENVLAYTYEEKKEKLYEISFDGTYKQVPAQFEKVKNAVRSDKRIFAAEDDTYYYAEYIRQGKALFKAQMVGDSLQTEQLINLGFSPKHKSWSAYIGDFLCHPQAKRLVHVYKYFKRILIFDPETKAEKVVRFNKDGVVAANDIVTLGPDNVTYYWGASSSANYIYLTYSGRTPIVVTRENGKTDGYIFVEQFDWNGTPIRKFRLDHWGPTYVNEETKKIYQLSYKYDDPLFVYDLPE